jgi:GNAT superfamily N-acetyltransferase
MSESHRSSEGLKYLKFKDIPDFESKLHLFLENLDEELVYWRGYEEKDGERRVRYPIVGYACLDGEEIVAISYYIVPRKLSLRWIYDRLFRPNGLEKGVVVKKEYQRLGIAKHLDKIKLGLLRELGHTQYWFRVDLDNLPSLSWAEKNASRVWKRTDDQVYFVFEVEE